MAMAVAHKCRPQSPPNRTIQNQLNDGVEKESPTAIQLFLPVDRGHLMIGKRLGIHAMWKLTALRVVYVCVCCMDVQCI